MNKARTLAPLIVAMVLLALTGCSAGDPEPGTEPDPGSTDTSEESPDGTDDTACVIDRVWTLDVPDLTEQVTAQVTSVGMPVVSSEGSGEMTIIFSDDSLVTSEGDVTFTLSVQAPDAPVSTLVQRQHGGGFGSWFWDGSADNVMIFEGWESTFAVDITMSVGGSSVEIPIELPDPVSGGSSMTATCVGQTLATNPEGSPFTQLWTTTD